MNPEGQMHKQIVRSSRVPNPVGSFALGTRAGPLLFLSPQVGIDPETGKLVNSCSELKDEVGRSFATGRLASDDWTGPVQAQCWQLFQNIKTVLEEQGASLHDILRINMWMTDFSDLPSLMPVRSRPFAPHTPPPITNIGASTLCVPGAVIQADVVVALPSEGGKREVIDSPKVSQFVGHYLLASRTGQMGFAAGMIAARNDISKVVKSYDDLDSQGKALATGSRVRDEIEEDVAAQSFFILRDLKNVLEDNGASFSDVIKTNVYLKDLRELPAWERVYTSFFDKNPPPTTIISCTELGVRGFRLEIEAAAILVPGPQKSELVTTQALPAPVATGASLSKAGGLIFLSGQFGIDPATNRVVTGYGDLGPEAKGLASGSIATDWREGAAASQTFTIFSNLRRALEEQGSSLDNLLKLCIFVTDHRDIPVIERVAARFFPSNPPACSIVEQPALPIRGAVVEIEGIAVVG